MESRVESAGPRKTSASNPVTQQESSSSDSDLVSVHVPRRLLLQSLLLTGGTADRTNTKISSETVFHMRKKLWLIQVFLLNHETSVGWMPSRRNMTYRWRWCRYFFKRSTWLILPSLRAADPAQGAARSFVRWAHAVPPVFGGRGRHRLSYLQT